MSHILVCDLRTSKAQNYTPVAADWCLYEECGLSMLGCVLSHWQQVSDALGMRIDQENSRSVVGVSSNVVFVCGHESYAGLGVEAERQASNHLQVQLSLCQLSILVPLASAGRTWSFS
jgi:hypothetical protein